MPLRHHSAGFRHGRTSRLALVKTPAMREVKRMNGLSDRAWIDHALSRANREEDIRAQHGPVKILVRDGKPVDFSEVNHGRTT